MTNRLPFLAHFSERPSPCASVRMRYDADIRMNVLLRSQTTAASYLGTVITETSEGRDASEIDTATPDTPVAALNLGTILTKTSDHGDQSEIDYITFLGTIKTGSGETSDPTDIE